VNKKTQKTFLHLWTSAPAAAVLWLSSSASSQVLGV